MCVGAGAGRGADLKGDGRDQFENNCFTEMCSGSEAGSYLRLIDFVCHSTLGLRVIKKKKKKAETRAASPASPSRHRASSEQLNRLALLSP